MNRLFTKFALLLLASLAIYGAFVFWSGFSEIRESLASFRMSMFALAVLLASANYALRILRWEYYLRRLGIRVPLCDSALTFLSGFAFTMTPGKVGEIFKSAVLWQTHQIPPEKTAPVVIAERLNDVIGVVALVFACSVGFDGGLVWAISGLACVVAGMAFILLKGPLEWLVSLMAFGPRKIRSFAPKAQSAVEALRIVSGRGAFVVPTLISIVAWGCEGLCLHVILLGFGVASNIQEAVFFYSTSTLAGALVLVVPGGLGITESLMQQLIVRVGNIAVSTATTGMLLTRFSTLWWAIFLGFLALGILKLRHPKFLSLKDAMNSAIAHKDDFVLNQTDVQESLPPNSPSTQGDRDIL